jgi:hypothetical protein
LKEKYSKYVYYVGQTIEDIFSPEQIERSVQLEARQLKTSIFINDGNGSFSIRPLPLAAQLSPVFTALVDDFNKDGNPDIILGGNLYRVKPEVGRYDASYGLFLEGLGDGSFREVKAQESGIRFKGEIRDLIQIQTPDKKLIIVARNNDFLQIFRYD